MQADIQRLLNCIGALVCIQRLANSVSQEDLGKGIRLSRAAVATIETARQSVYVDQVYDMAKALKVDMASLLPDDEVLFEVHQQVFRTLLEKVRPNAIHRFARLVVPTAPPPGDNYLSSRENEEQNPKPKKPRAPRKPRPKAK